MHIWNIVQVIQIGATRNSPRLAELEWWSWTVTCNSLNNAHQHSQSWEKQAVQTIDNPNIKPGCVRKQMWSQLQSFIIPNYRFQRRGFIYTDFFFLTCCYRWVILLPFEKRNKILLQFSQNVKLSRLEKHKTLLHKVGRSDLPTGKQKEISLALA